jgi:hypothetical protein
MSPSTFNVVTLISRPERNAAQEASRHTENSNSLVWEAIGFTREGRAWQWRAWCKGEVVSVVTWSRRDRAYLATAMNKSLGQFKGSGWRPADAQSIPPSDDAITAISYAVVDMHQSERLARESVDAFERLRCDEIAAVKAAVRAMCDAHEARWAVDERDEEAVLAANDRVVAAYNGVQKELNALKLPEERQAEITAAVEVAVSAAFNPIHN